ncbi:MAG: PDGLE domain-containing protein [Methanobrevibacter sp.]|nr:PDGLE domain-containing protein [Methanobrevibacter sp.]
MLIVGLIIAILIAAVSAFIASTDPDGLEKTMEDILPEEILHEIEESHLIESPMPDYEIEAFGEGPIGTLISFLVGTIIVFILALGLGYLLKRKNKNE